jgi:hypothetical protein
MDGRSRGRLVALTHDGMASECAATCAVATPTTGSSRPSARSTQGRARDRIHVHAHCNRGRCGPPRREHERELPRERASTGAFVTPSRR